MIIRNKALLITLFGLVCCLSAHSAWRVLKINNYYSEPITATITANSKVTFRNDTLVFANELVYLEVPISDIENINGSKDAYDINVGVEKIRKDSNDIDKEILYHFDGNGIYVTLKKDESAIRIYNLAGLTISDSDRIRNGEYLPLEKLKKGIYFVEIDGHVLKVNRR